MRTFLRTVTILFFTAAIFTSCVKVNVTPPESPFAGTWQLADAAEGDAYGWSSFYTGLETGIFYLSSSGAAQYTDAGISMQGSWYLRTVNGGYFDEYGSYYNSTHQELELHLADPYTHSTIDLRFDNVSMYGNRFVGTYFNGDYIERYGFNRY